VHKAKAYWWRQLPNFGDRLNWTILKSLEVEPAWRSPAEAELVMVGSVLEHLPPGWSGTVCGAGKLHEDSVVDLTHARVLALRGHLTAAGVCGLPAHCPVVLGDPSLLMPQWVRQPPAKYELGVIPHWSDDKLRTRFPYGHFIDPTGPPDQVVAEIARCKRVISSSLHGIIVADAYGIPRQAELFPRAPQEGGDFKFRDYASIYGESPHFGEMWLAPYDVVERTRGELREVLEMAVGRPRPPAPIPAPDIEPWVKGPHCPQISLLVPFRDDGEHRSRVWHWLRRYWHGHLQSVEIIQGHDGGYPFSKAVAVNNAAERARGRVLVVLDADAYLDSRVVQECADTIEAALAAGRRLWFIPYNNLYRLNQPTTLELLATNPEAPYAVGSPPPPGWLESDHHSQAYGHQYGALIQIMPREAFFTVGGMDPRFRGWGSEDASLLRALDTLYCQHEVTSNDVVHLWHVRPGSDWTTRRWVGQQWSPANSRLAQRYAQATSEPGFMRALVEERRVPQQAPPRRCGWPAPSRGEAPGAPVGRHAPAISPVPCRASSPRRPSRAWD